MDYIKLNVIGHIYNDFTEKFGIPRQSGLVPEMVSQIIFEKEYRAQEALRGIEEFSHLWLIWHFSQNSKTQWSPCVRPPRLGGNKRVGVFATRSPFRPNPIGLSSVKLEKVEYTKDKGAVLYVSGADILSGTPIFDIKPYIAYSDSHPDAKCGFADDKLDYSLKVNFPENLLKIFPKESRSTVIAMLKNDPRPSYQDDDRTYNMCYGYYEVKFIVKNNILTVTDIAQIKK